MIHLKFVEAFANQLGYIMLY